MKRLIIVALALTVFVVGLLYKNSSAPKSISINKDAVKSEPVNTNISIRKQVVVLKDVGEAYIDNFGLTDEDFALIKSAGFDIIESNFDICASDAEVSFFLSKANEYDLSVIMPAGSGEAEWGYECDSESYPPDQKPVWRDDAVINWVNKWKDNPAIFAWDISNEAGSVFPNASWENDNNNKVPDALYITSEQLKKAYRDVKAADPERPLMIRMNGWFFYDEVDGKTPVDDDFFRAGNPFCDKCADIVMINAYSNVSDYFTDFVELVTSRGVNSIKQIDPQAEIWVSLGAWEEKPLWYLPKVENLKKEIYYLKDSPEVSGLAYFKYGAKQSEWYLPKSAPQIWEEINLNK